MKFGIEIKDAFIVMQSLPLQKFPKKQQQVGNILSMMPKSLPEKILHFAAVDVMQVKVKNNFQNGWSQNTAMNAILMQILLLR